MSFGYLEVHQETDMSEHFLYKQSPGSIFKEFSFWSPGFCKAVFFGEKCVFFVVVVNATRMKAILSFHSYV